ncbi:DNA processing protein DprA [Pandoraea iniqua]|uniref:DNA processing protein DprA n=1 Tax=Pandoraea iniqua TaxID=2508288 RepID=A0A5E4RY89_9BURK|nr:DNA processing protein DprA [Pandoraea iniqua]
MKTGYRRIAIGVRANSQSSDGETRRELRAAGFASLGPPVNAYRMMKNFITAPLSPLAGGAALPVSDGPRREISATDTSFNANEARDTAIDASQIGAGAEDIKAWLRLCATPQVPSAAVRRLLAAFGLPDAIFRATAGELARVVPHEIAGRLLARPSAALRELIDRTLDWAAQPGCTVLTLAEADYPRALFDLGDAPPMLYCCGNATLANRAGPAAVAIVGSRLASPQGRENARRFARQLGEAGITIISGLAAGIDAAAHEGALDTLGGTCAVIGTGPDSVYPACNRALAERIGGMGHFGHIGHFDDIEHAAGNGLVISPFPVGTPPRPGHFPQRNRLIAALARCTLVVEAATRSGSLITARLAGELGRDVLALPGSIHAQQSAGCHALIRDGATLVTSPDDVLEALGLPGNTAASPPVRGRRVPSTTTTATTIPATPRTPPSPARPNRSNRPAGSTHLPAPPRQAGPAIRQPSGLAPPAAAILEALGYDPSSADTLCARTGLNIVTVLQQLSVLELDGWIARAPGACFVRLTPQAPA